MIRKRFRDWLMHDYVFPTAPYPVTGQVIINEMKQTVMALFEKYVTPRIEQLVENKFEPVVAAQLRELLVRSHDEWTRELTTTLLRHVNAEKESSDKSLNADAQ